MESSRNLAACANDVQALVMFCTIYPINVPVTYVSGLFNSLLTVLVFTSAISSRRISTSNVDGLVIVDISVVSVTVDFRIDCKY